MTVGTLLRSMSSSEFTEWQAVHLRLDPFGEARKDLRAGSIASPLLNIQIAKGQKTKSTDWIMRFRESTPQTTKQMMMICKAIADAAKLEADRKNVRKTRRPNEHRH